MEAFRLAAEQGADGIETDLRHTADGVIVLFHDAAVPGMGPVAETSFEGLRRRHPQVATLDDLLPLSAELILDLEIKNDLRQPGHDPSHRMADEVARWVGRHGLRERVIVSSFNPATIAAVLQHDARIVTGRLLHRGIGTTAELASITAVGHRFVLPHVSRIGLRPRAFVTAAHEVGLAVAVWTVDRPGTVARLAGAGVDAVITNDPVATRDAID